MEEEGAEVAAAAAAAAAALRFLVGGCAMEMFGFAEKVDVPGIPVSLESELTVFQTPPAAVAAAAVAEEEPLPLAFLTVSA